MYRAPRLVAYLRCCAGAPIGVIRRTLAEGRAKLAPHPRARERVDCVHD
jgi:hypothetical protein